MSLYNVLNYFLTKCNFKKNCNQCLNKPNLKKRPSFTLLHFSRNYEMFQYPMKKYPSNERREMSGRNLNLFCFPFGFSINPFYPFATLLRFYRHAGRFQWKPKHFKMLFIEIERTLVKNPRFTLFFLWFDFLPSVATTTLQICVEEFPLNVKFKTPKKHNTKKSFYHLQNVFFLK